MNIDGSGSNFGDPTSTSGNHTQMSAGHPDPPHPSSQQKRQSSLSGYMSHNSNKRIPNPLQMPMSMQMIQDYHFDQGHQGNNSAQGGPKSPRASNNSHARGHLRRSMVHPYPPSQQLYQNVSGSMKTPTPSAYDVPSSPNIKPMSNISVQNNSDSSESNNVNEQSNNMQNQEQQLANDIPYSSKDISITASINSNINHSSYPLKQDSKSNNQAPRASSSQGQDQRAQSDQGNTSTRVMSDEEQQLATKLKETYKNIVNFEEIVQKNCIEITMKMNEINSYSSGPSSAMGYNNMSLLNQQLSSSVNSNSSVSSNSNKVTGLSNDLWTIYHRNITLLDNYYDFLITALKPSSNQTQYKTGKNIVDLYKIPRRMWVYGIVGFLEVLKNITTIFQDHEICQCFIAYCFNIVSNLTDPILEMEGWWSEKLGDLSRMAIALYSSKFIDWKISAEYWYSLAMKTLYGHGKVYYHMSTVQQDNLDALVNIGKSVICRDPFVPTQNYLRLVVENICTQRNILSLLELPIIDFIKIHKVLLSIHNSSSTNEGSIGSIENIHDTQIQYGIDLVTRYGLTFGSDSNGYNFFTRELYTSQGVSSAGDPRNPYYVLPQGNTANTAEKVNFWFNKGPLFAIANVNHLIGFGDAKNPFARLFMLPESLKERKDKKDKKRKSRGGITNDQDDNRSIGSGSDGQIVSAAELSVNDWFFCLKYINKSVLELSFRILNHYLIGAKQVSTSHVIVWLYFMIAVGEATNKLPNSKNMFHWLFRKLFPWESFINYLNSLLEITKNTSRLTTSCRYYLISQDDYMKYFNENEFLPEVWKCWGTLWFDFISQKSDYTDLESAGVKNSNMFDLPVCGTSPVSNMSSVQNKSEYGIKQEHDERIVRVILLAKHFADKYDFGLVRTKSKFKFDNNIYQNIDNLVPNTNHQIPAYSYVEEFLLGDGRLVQNNFIQKLSPSNITSKDDVNLSVIEKDDFWFGVSLSFNKQGNVNFSLGQTTGLVNEDNLEIHAGSEFDDDVEEGDFEHSQEQPYLSSHNMFHQQQHNVALQMARRFVDDGQESMVQSPYQEFHEFTDPEKTIIDGNLGDRMDTNITYITLDTNIWLKHCGRIFKCIRDRVLKISIPLIVFQELRSLRKSTETTIADAATRSVIIIRELYLTREILPLRFDGTVASDINETTEFENNSNWKSIVDETILNAVNEHDQIGKKLMKGINMSISPLDSKSNKKGNLILSQVHAKVFKYCVLITDDRNMHLRAKSIGLTSFQSKWLFSLIETVFPNRCID